MLSQYQAFLVFAVFIASGISFLPGKSSQIVIPLTVSIVGIVSFLLISAGILFGIGFSAGFGARSFGQDGVRMLGAALITLYFAVCALTCLPILLIRNSRRFGLMIHFIFLPIAVGLWTLSAGAINVPLSFRLGAYANELTLGLAYAMLWFRMVDVRAADSASKSTPDV